MAKVKKNLIGTGLDIMRGILEMMSLGVDDKSESKERALPTYKIYEYVDKVLGMNGYCSNVYIDPTGVFAVAVMNDGKLFKSMVTVTANDDIELSPWVETVTNFTPVSRGISVKRQADGKVRWYAWPACTAALNRSGEIDSRELFDSFIKNIERTGEYPELDFFHLGHELVLGRADYVTREDYTYCATGLFYDSDIARLAISAIEADPEYWGNSIQYYPTEAPEILVTEDGSKIPVYTDGVNRFISLLPEETAASILTSISTEGVNRMKKQVKLALEKIGVGKDVIAELEQRTRAINEDLEGEIKRDKTAAAPVVEKPASTDAVAKAILKSPDFRAVLREALDEIISDKATPAPAAAAPATEADDEPTEDEETTPESNERFASLESKLDEILNRMNEDDEDTEEELRTILEDLPSKVKNQRIIRPRMSRNSADQQPKTLAVKAGSALDKIRANRSN